MYIKEVDILDMIYTINVVDSGMTFVLEPTFDPRFDWNVSGVIASDFLRHK